MTYEELLKIGLGAVPVGYDTSENSFIHQAVSAAAVIGHELFIRLSHVEDMQWLDNWSGEVLDRRVYDATGLTRRPPVRAQGMVCLTFAADTFVSAENLKLEYNGYIFRPLYADDAKANTPVDMLFEAETPGFIGAVPPNSLRQVQPSTVRLIGLTHDAFSPGADQESDAQLKDRYRAFYTEHAVTNNPAQFKAWALEVPGVSQARVLRAEGTPGVVTIYILGAGYSVPSKELLGQVKQNIESKMGFDVRELRVLAPTPKAVRLHIRCRLVPNVAPDLAQQALQEALDGYLAFTPDPNFIIRKLYKYEFVPVLQKAGVIAELIDIIDVDTPEAVMWEFKDTEVPSIRVSEVTAE